MKQLILLFTIYLISATANAQEIPKPAKGKSMIIFSRPAMPAPITQFKFFDSSLFIGQIAGGSNLVYECEPGRHLIWASSENFDFLEAELSPDEIYLVDAQVRTGAFRANVHLAPFDPNNKKAEKVKIRLLKRAQRKKMKKYDPNDDTNMTRRHDKADINQGLNTYKNKKKKNKTIRVITKDMHI